MLNCILRCCYWFCCDTINCFHHFCVLRDIHGTSSSVLFISSSFLWYFTASLNFSHELLVLVAYVYYMAQLLLKTSGIQIVTNTNYRNYHIYAFRQPFKSFFWKVLIDFKFINNFTYRTRNKNQKKSPASFDIQILFYKLILVLSMIEVFPGIKLTSLGIPSTTYPILCYISITLL